MADRPYQYLAAFNAKYDAPIARAKNAQSAQHVSERLPELFRMVGEFFPDGITHGLPHGSVDRSKISLNNQPMIADGIRWHVLRGAQFSE